ncbi:MAG: AbrB/MazE/SpoVT family DNA-binding domain-containing protein [Pseudomonadota bacterium]
MAFEAVKIHDSPDGQSIKIPESLKIDDDKVYVKKAGNVLYIIPFHNSWQDLIDSVEDFTPDFMDDRNQPSQHA